MWSTLINTNNIERRMMRFPFYFTYQNINMSLLLLYTFLVSIKKATKFNQFWTFRFSVKFESFVNRKIVYFSFALPFFPRSCHHVIQVNWIKKNIHIPHRNTNKRTCGLYGYWYIGIGTYVNLHKLKYPVCSSVILCISTFQLLYVLIFYFLWSSNGKKGDCEHWF